MTFRLLSYVIAAVPLVLFAAAVLLNHLGRTSPIQESGAFFFSGLSLGLLALHLIGGWFYASFALVVGLFAWRLGPSAHRKLTYLSPVAFAFWVLVLLALCAQQPLTEDLGGLTFVFICALAIGYLYVALLLLVWHTLPNQLRKNRTAV